MHLAAASWLGYANTSTSVRSHRGDDPYVCRGQRYALESGATTINGQQVARPGTVVERGDRIVCVAELYMTIVVIMTMVMIMVM